MSLPTVTAREVDTGADWCHRCEERPATDHGILCRWCRVVCLVIEPEPPFLPADEFEPA